MAELGKRHAQLILEKENELRALFPTLCDIAHLYNRKAISQPAKEHRQGCGVPLEFPIPLRRIQGGEIETYIGLVVDGFEGTVRFRVNLLTRGYDVVEAFYPSGLRYFYWKPNLPRWMDEFFDFVRKRAEGG